MKTLLFIFIGLITVVGVNVWAAGRDKLVLQANLLYDACVKREYGMTPIKWYEEQDKYPRCGN